MKIASTAFCRFGSRTMQWHGRLAGSRQSHLLGFTNSMRTRACDPTTPARVFS